MQRQILSDLRESHQGSVHTKQQARMIVYWPGIDNNTDNIISSCKKCQDILPANAKEPLISLWWPELFNPIVDCFTDWPDIIPMGNNTTAMYLIQVLRQYFCRTAIPDILWSDGGLHFTAKCFQDFSRQWGFTHKMSSSYHLQSNGKIKATVKSMKTSWGTRTLNENKLCRAILQYRNIPSHKDGPSLAQQL